MAHLYYLLSTARPRSPISGFITFRIGFLWVAGLNFHVPLDFCIVGASENSQRLFVDGNVEVHFQTVLAITTASHVPATQNRFSADLDLLVVMSFSVQPDDERTLVVNAVDTMYPFYEGEWVRGIWTASCG